MAKRNYKNGVSQRTIKLDLEHMIRLILRVQQEEEHFLELGLDSRKLEIKSLEELFVQTLKRRMILLLKVMLM